MATKMLKTWVQTVDTKFVYEFGQELVELLPFLLDDTVSVDQFTDVLSRVLKKDADKHTT